jgi:hypothetical protein
MHPGNGTVDKETGPHGTKGRIQENEGSRITSKPLLEDELRYAQYAESV